MKKLLGILGSIGAFVLLLIAMSAGNMLGKATVNSMYAPDIDSVLARTADKVNQSLPMMVDKETRLDTTTPGVYGSGKSFNYFYTLVNYSSHSIESQFIGTLTPQVKQNVCGSSEMRKSLALGVTAVYIYRGNDGVEVGRIPVSEADCLGSQQLIRQTAYAPTVPPPVVTIDNVLLGTSVDSSLQVVNPQTEFKPTDTIIASVSTSALSHDVDGELSVHWTYGSGAELQTVHRDTKRVRFSGHGVTSFQISKPDGWPAGNYSAEFKLNGAQARAASFQVSP